MHEGYGAQRIATYLNNQGYRARSGKMWHHATIRGILCNLTYTGVLRSGESRSPVLPHLQIISPELFEAAQRIRTNQANETERTVPRNIAGQSLLSENVYCGHCEARLNPTISGKAYPCKEDPHQVITRVRQIFERMKAIPKSEVVNTRYREKMKERKNLLRSIRADYTKAADELDMLKAEVIKALRGESAFSKDLLGSMVSEAEAKCTKLQKQFENAQAAYEEGQTVLHSLDEQYDNVISWADLYDTASLEAKKMIVNCLIRRVEVYRDYKLHIDFNIDFTQFSLGLDIVEIAA